MPIEPPLFQHPQEAAEAIRRSLLRNPFAMAEGPDPEGLLRAEPGALTTLTAARRPEAAPLLIIAQEAKPPQSVIQRAVGAVLQSGDPLRARFGPETRLALLNVGAGLAYERGDVDFQIANRWSEALAASLPPQTNEREAAYFEPVRRLARSAAAQAMARDAHILRLTQGIRRNDPLVIVSGGGDWRPLADELLRQGLGDEGLAVLHAPAETGLAARLRRFLRLWRLRRSSERIEASRDLAEAARSLKLASIDAGARDLVAADLRDMREARWAPSAFAILQALKDRGAPALLTPGGNFWRKRRLRLEAQRWSLLRGVRNISTPAAPNPKRTPVWVAPILEALAEKLIAEPHASVFLREAGRRLPVEWPLALATGMAVEAWCAQGGRRVFCVPGNGRLIGMSAALAARRTEGVSLEVQTLMVSRSARYDPPLTTHIACIDHAQRDIYVHHLQTDPERAVVVGSLPLDIARAAPKTGDAQNEADLRPILLYPTQGLPEFDAQALAFLREAAPEAAGWRLLVTAHPSMKAAAQRNLEARLGAPIPWASHASGGVLKNPRLRAVCTLFSNVGYEAALRGLPVLRLDVGGPYQTDLAAMGLARAIGTQEDLSGALKEIAAGVFAPPPAFAAFRALNPELLDGRSLERILKMGRKL